eukprot:1185040-Prorocentrum_minimum.AAC.1
MGPSLTGLDSSVQRRVRRESGGGQEGIYRSSLDARKPQNPTYSEEYQGHLQGVHRLNRGDALGPQP